MKIFGLFCAVSFLFVGCDKIGVGNNLADALPGWTADGVKRLIACEPVESKECKCTVEKITKKYTPDQVKEKSPLVAADMLGMAKSCDASMVASEKPSSASMTGGSISSKFGYEFREVGCTTGQQNPLSHLERCEVLQSRGKNRGCALKERRRVFEQLCGMGFEEQP